MNEDLIALIVREVSNRLQRADPPDSEEEYHRWRYSVISGSGDNDYLPDITEYDLQEKAFVTCPADAEFLARLKRSTPARLGLGRTGPRYLTVPWLRFRADHARAVDAVFSEVPADFVEGLGLLEVQTRCSSREEYVQRPDLGRRLSDEGKQALKAGCKHRPVVQVLVTDGLSSSAIVENAGDFLLALNQGLSQEGLERGTPLFVRYGRVAVMDDVGELLEPEVVVELVGERPGLVTAKSMSSYLCYRPRRGTVESDRNVVANIHSGGIPAVEAGAHVASMVKQILARKASGVRFSLGGGT
ncbi:MAG: ethanolamine ammonia-lyase subunit EutC [Ignavibacteriales bacterium]